MTRRMILPLVFGLAGAAILVGLGIWQLQRLEWKRGVLAGMEARISAAPVALPAAPGPEADNYRAVRLAGRIGAEELHVLVTRKSFGPGFRVVAPFETADGRRILLDRGYVREVDKDAPRAAGPAEVTGNLIWPDDYDPAFTPPPDTGRNIWFARQLPEMAEALGTAPVMVVVRDSTRAEPTLTPWPVDSSGVANDHLEYAITWFSLAVLWLGMTAYLLWRIRRRTV